MFLINTEFFANHIHDAQVGLMRNIKIHVVRSRWLWSVHCERFPSFFYRSLKDQAAVHADERITDDFTAVDMTVCGQYMHSARAVCLQFRSQNTGLIGFSRTTAPAPSPNKTQVVLSFQSKHETESLHRSPRRAWQNQHESLSQQSKVHRQNRNKLPEYQRHRRPTHRESPELGKPCSGKRNPEWSSRQ